MLQHARQRAQGDTEAEAEMSRALFEAAKRNGLLRMNAKACREDIVEAKCKVREALDDEEFEHVTTHGDEDR